MKNTSYLKISLFSTAIVLIYLIILFNNASKNEVKASIVELVTSNSMCYNRLINDFFSVSDEMILLRANYHLGNSDPLNISPNFRFIETSAIENLVSSDLRFECLDSLISKNIIKGIRFIDDKNIIVEIASFNWHTNKDQFNRQGTLETHRIIRSKKKIDIKMYAFPAEKIVKEVDLDDNLTYQITHVSPPI